MFRSTLLATLTALLVLGLAGTAVAWKGETMRGVEPIAEVLEKAERGDYVVVEGEVARVTSGQGNRMVVIFRDSTGEVPLAVPNHLLRRFNGGEVTGGSGPSGVRPQVGRRARVGGQWDHAKMDDETWGIRVTEVEPIED